MAIWFRRRPILGLIPAMLFAASPVAAQEIQLDSAQLLNDVRILADDNMQGRLVATAGSAAARAYLIGRLHAIGVRPFGGNFSHPFSTRNQNQILRGVNLIGHIPGRSNSDQLIVIGAHYDHFGMKGDKVLNGADDNASGVATVLAIAADFIRHPPEHSVVIALWDAEEQGLLGSSAFMRSPLVDKSRIAMTLNLDMISRSTRDELWIAGAYHYPFLRPYFETLAAQAPVNLKLGHDGSKGDGELDDWTDGSDHYPFHEQGIPFAYMGVEDYPDYHGPGDDFDTIPQGFFIRAATTALIAARLFDRELTQIAAAKQAQGKPVQGKETAP